MQIGTLVAILATSELKVHTFFLMCRWLNFRMGNGWLDVRRAERRNQRFQMDKRTVRVEAFIVKIFGTQHIHILHFRLVTVLALVSLRKLLVQVENKENTINVLLNIQ